MALSLDGTPVQAIETASQAFVTLPGFSTAAGSGLIVVGTGTNAASIPSVTATGLTFTSRQTLATAGWTVLAIHTAIYTTNFSGTVTVNLASATTATACVFAIGGADTITIFDPHAGIPATNGGGASNITTTNATDFIYCVNSITASGAATPGAGWTAIGPGTNFLQLQYQIVAAPQAALTDTLTAGAMNGSIMDAVIQGAASVIATSLTPLTMGTSQLLSRTIMIGY